MSRRDGRVHDPYSYPPRGMRHEEAARYLGISRTTFDNLVAKGTLPRAKQISPGRVVWDRFQLDLAFHKLAEKENAKSEFERYMERNRGGEATGDWKLVLPPEEPREQAKRALEQQQRENRWNEARELLLRDGGVSRDRLVRVVGRDEFSEKLLLAKTGLKEIVKTGGLWEGKI